MAKSLAFYHLVTFDHLACQEYEDAVELATEAIERFPDDGRLWQALGIALRRLRRFPEAQEALENASVLVPLNPFARCALADCYFVHGKAKLARGIYRFLARSSRIPTSALAALAAGLGQVGEERRALSICRELARRVPNHHGAHFGIGYYLSRLGEDARIVLPHLERACELAPANAMYQANLALVHLALGDAKQAVESIRDVSPTQICCPPMIEKLVGAMESTKEWLLAANWRRRLAELH